MKKVLLGLALVSSAAFAVWNLRGDDPQPAESDYVVDRFWIDHIPRSEREVFQIFVAVSEQPMGVFQSTSQWKGNYEFFRYEKHGNELRVFFGQTGERERVKAKSAKCTEKGMDFCLELDGSSRGVKKYYSMKGWEIDGATSIDELRARIAEQVKTLAIEASDD